MTFETLCSWSSPGVPLLAVQLCGTTALVTSILTSSITKFVCERATEKSRLEDQKAKKDLSSELESAQHELADASEWKAKLAQAAEETNALKHAIAELQACLDNSSVPIVSVDRRGLVTFWNQKSAEVFRCSAGQAMQRRLTSFLVSSDSKAFSPASIVSSMTARGGIPAVNSCQRTLRARNRGSGEAWQEMVLHIYSRLNSEGGVEGLWCIGQDVTKLLAERRQAESATQDLSRLISTVNAPLIGVDSNGCVTDWNRKAELLTGYTQAEAMGKNLVQHFITKEFADAVQKMVSQGLRGEDITNYEFSLFTKGGQRLEILMSASPRRDRGGAVVGVVGIGKDITELRSESKMLANYVRICGAAVWSLRGHSVSGTVTECKTKEIEHLISQQAQMDSCDPRMVLWRASFVSILKTMCRNFWMHRKSTDAVSEKVGGATPTSNTLTRLASSLDSSLDNGNATNDFGYEFCFEAASGQVKWYKVEGHLIEESLTEGKFEVTGSMQEVTSMWIDKVMGDRWQKWWSRMCHMVFDATLLVDTQEYRVLNAWGEEKVFGSKLPSHHPLLQLIKSDDTVSLKEAFNEVTFKGFEHGRKFNLRTLGGSKEVPAHCFLLAADNENPNECMMGIRKQVSKPGEGDCGSVLWDVARPTQQVMTLEDLARLKSGLKRHRRPSRSAAVAVRSSKHPLNTRSSGAPTSLQSLSSIPEDLEDLPSEDGDDLQSVSGASVTSSKSSFGSESGSESGEGGSYQGACGSSPPRSQADTLEIDRAPSFQLTRSQKRAAFQLQPKPRDGPVLVRLRSTQATFDLNLAEFATIGALRAHIQAATGIPSNRQTLILAGKRLPLGNEEEVAGEPSWEVWKMNIKPGQTLMLIGSPAKTPIETSSAGDKETGTDESQPQGDSEESKQADESQSEQHIEQ